MEEAKAFNRIESFDIFSSNKLKEILGSERMTYVYLKKWIEEGKIVKLPFFFYSLIDKNTGKYKANLYELACRVEEGAFLVLVSAGKIHGINLPETDTIYVSTNKRFALKEFDGWYFKPRILPDSFGIVKKNSIRYTDYTRTVVDIIREFDKYMSLNEFLEFLDSVKELNFKKIKEILKAYDSNILFQKVGWLNEEGLISVDNPVELSEFCISRIGKSHRFFCKDAKKGGIHIARWQLMVPEELMKQVR